MRLIDADALYDRLSSFTGMFTDEIGFAVNLNQVLDCIDVAPTIEQPTWISVKYRLPEKANDYLCRCIVNEVKNYPFYMVLRYILIDENPHFQHEMTGGIKVTHWMPLPQPPKGVK